MDFLKLLETPISRRRLFKGAGQTGVTYVLSKVEEVSGGLILKETPTSPPVATPPSVSKPLDVPYELQRRVGDVAVAGEFEWGVHAEPESLIRALTDLRSHLETQSTGSRIALAPALRAANEEFGVKFGPRTLRPILRYSRCDGGALGELAEHLRTEAERIRMRREKFKERIIERSPLQYVVCDRVGLILGIQSKKPGHLLKFLGRDLRGSFTPKHPSTPNHRVGFSGKITQIHCIESNDLYIFTKGK